MVDVAEWPKWLNDILTKLDQSSTGDGPSATHGPALIAGTLRKELRDVCLELHHLHLERKALKEERDRMRLMLVAIKGWCSRQSNAAYAERLALHGLGESTSPPPEEP